MPFGVYGIHDPGGDPDRFPSGVSVHLGPSSSADDGNEMFELREQRFLLFDRDFEGEDVPLFPCLLDPESLDALVGVVDGEV